MGLPLLLARAKQGILEWECRRKRRQKSPKIAAKAPGYRVTAVNLNVGKYATLS